jgi:hypothetical protein
MHNPFRDQSLNTTEYCSYKINANIWDYLDRLLLKIPVGDMVALVLVLIFTIPSCSFRPLLRPSIRDPRLPFLPHHGESPVPWNVRSGAAPLRVRVATSNLCP